MCGQHGGGASAGPRMFRGTECGGGGRGVSVVRIVGRIRESSAALEMHLYMGV